MSGKAPSPYQLEKAMGELLSVRSQLLAIDPDIQNDEQLYGDMLDGEAGNALQVLERLIECSIEADALAAGAKARKDNLAERQARFERRRDMMRSAALAALQALGLNRLERAEYTASLAQRPPSVVVTDPDKLPDWAVKIERKPDKTALAPLLKAGAGVPGATLSNGGVSLTIRTK